MENLKYPIGQYEPNLNPKKELLQEWIKTIESFPLHVEKAIER